MAEGGEDIVNLGISLDATSATQSAERFNTRLEQLVEENRHAQAEVDKLTNQLRQLDSQLDKSGSTTKQNVGAQRSLAEGMSVSGRQAAESAAVTAKWNDGLLKLKQTQDENARTTNWLTESWTKFTSAGRGASGVLGTLLHSFKELALPIAALFSLHELKAVLSESVKEATEAEKSQIRLASVIRATGGAAGVSAREVERLVSEIQETTLQSDESARDVAALIMSFRGISGDVFKEAVKLTGDLSSVMGRDFTGIAMMLGRALSDPAQGLEALSRAGVRFNEVTTTTIKRMAQMGDVAGAQKLILDQLEQRVGGTAAALGDPDKLPGAIGHAHHAWMDFLESLGKTEAVTGPVIATMHALSSVLKFFTNSEDDLANAEEALAGFRRQMEALQSTTVSKNGVGLDPGRLAGMKAREKELEDEVAYQKALEVLFERSAQRQAEEQRRAQDAARAEAERVGVLSQIHDKILSLGKDEYYAQRLAVQHNQEMSEAVRQATLELIDAQQKFADAEAERQSRMQIDTLGADATSASYAALALERLTARQRAAKEAVIAATAAYRDQQTALEAQTEVEARFLSERQKIEASEQQRELDVNKALSGIYDQNAALEIQIDLLRKMGAASAQKELTAHQARQTFLALNPSPEDLARFDEMLTYNKKLNMELDQSARESRVWEQAWEKAVQSTQANIADFIVSLGDMTASVEDFFKGLFKLIQQTAAEAAAADLTGLLGGLFKGMVGGGGVLPAPDASFIDAANAGVPTALPMSSLQAGNTVNIHVAPSYTITSLDPRTSAEVIRSQKGSLTAVLVEAVRDSRELQQALRGR